MSNNQFQIEPDQLEQPPLRAAMLVYIVMLCGIMMASVALSGCSTVSSNARLAPEAPTLQVMEQVSPTLSSGTWVAPIEQSASKLELIGPVRELPSERLNENKPDIGSPEYADEYEELEQDLDDEDVVGC